MRSLMLAAALSVGGLAVPVVAQSTLDNPVGLSLDYAVDSGAVDNPAQFTTTVFIEPIAIEDVPWLRVNFGFRPLALAAVRPAFVRSRIRLRSNSAKAPNIWKMSLPPEDRVSIAS